MNRTNLIEDFTLLPLPAWWQSPWVVLLFGLLVVGVGALVWGWWRRRKNQVLVAAPLALQPDRSPEFLSRLAALRTRRSELGAYPFAIECSDILREFVEWRFQLAIRFQTTREFLEAARRHAALAPKQRDGLGTYLGFCDLVKFARQGATEAEQIHLLDAAESFVRECAPAAAVAEVTSSR